MGDDGADDGTDDDADDGGVVLSLAPLTCEHTTLYVSSFTKARASGNDAVPAKLYIRLRCRNASGDFTL